MFYDILIMCFIVYPAWFFGGAALGMVFHFYGILKEAIQERREEAQFKEIKKVTPSLVIVNKEINKY